MHLAGDGRLQALPQPVLQRVEADEHGIGGEQAGADCPRYLRALPGELRRVDEHQACRRARAGARRSVIGIRREAGDVRERRRVQRDRGRRVEFEPAPVVTKAKY